MSVMIEIPQMVIDSGAVALSAALIGAGFSCAVIAVDYAFDKVKESAYELLRKQMEK